LNYFVEFSHFLDNREYSGNGDKYAVSQTMLGARLNAMLGAKIDSTQGIMAGANYLLEYGDKIDGNTPTVNLFYHYQKNGLTGFLGSFPRRGLFSYPLALLSDTLDNYRPNIQGAYLETSGKWGYDNFWCDWTVYGRFFGTHQPFVHPLFRSLFLHVPPGALCRPSGRGSHPR
jgi:hypothetical protein